MLAHLSNHSAKSHPHVRTDWTDSFRLAIKGCVTGCVSLTQEVLSYSETCEIRTPLGQVKSVPYSKVSSIQGAICTENSSMGPDEVSLYHRMSSFCRVAIHRFYCKVRIPIAIF
jgi:hypothetical protein